MVLDHSSGGSCKSGWTRRAVAAKPGSMPAASSNERAVTVREIPIELCQFLKFGGLAGSGGEAKQLIGEGGVLVNDAVETRKRKKLTMGDRVTVEGQSIIVQLA